MKLWNLYQLPETVEEAVALLGARTAVIAGGTDLLLDLQQDRHPPVEAIVDVNHIDEMQRIEEREDSIYVGAAVSLHRIIESDLLNHHALGLVDACRRIGGPQVRNVATLGGNVGHALPAGDGTIALMSLNTEAQLASEEGRRWVPLEGLFAGPGRPTFDRSQEIITDFRFSKRAALEGSSSTRVMRPQGVAIAILNMAVWLRLNKDSEIADARIAVGPAGPTPLRARETEIRLKGQSKGESMFASGVDGLLQEAQLRTSPYRATKEYRRHLLEVLLRRCMEEAFLSALPGN
ncbi:MAG: xanthine dehydrogenase family protein subunit M [Anaerolineales bacterium]